MFIELGYLGLFIASFLSSTIIPMASGAVLAALIYNGFDPYWCILIATVGNTLGGMTSYWIGHLGKMQWIEKYFRVPKEKILSFQERIKRWGPMTGLLAWLPLIGDVIAIALGFFRLNPWRSFIYMFIGRIIRYTTLGLIMQLF